MAPVDDPEPRLALTRPIPEDGLRHVLSTWAGEGDLYRALASIRADDVDHEWSEADIRRRAHRIMFEMVEGFLSRWPHRLAEWHDALPITTSTTRLRAPYPFSGISWTETWRRSGFPPSECHGRSRRRSEDSVLAATLRWAIERALDAASAAEKTWGGATINVSAQLKAAAQLMTLEPLASTIGVVPNRVELLAVRREGPPWGAVADAAAVMRILDQDAMSVAFTLLLPDVELRPRLFHLGVFGTCLIALADLGFHLKSLRPISGGFYGPTFRATAPEGREWDVWFEGQGAWAYYGRVEPYRSVVRGAGVVYRPLGADVLIISPNYKAFAIECKYGGAEYVCRDGYHQAVTYVVEAKELASDAAALVVGPEGVVDKGETETHAGRVTVTCPSKMAEALSDFLN